MQEKNMGHICPIGRSRVNTVDDCSVLQSDLNSVYNWAEVNNMLFKASKFDYLLFVCKKNSFVQCLC